MLTLQKWQYNDPRWFMFLVTQAAAMPRPARRGFFQTEQKPTPTAMVLRRDS
jgi:hypothetical protein